MQMLKQFARDVQFGARLLGKSRGFVASAIVVIALGVGAVTAIATVVYGVMLDPLPYEAPERLVSIRSLVHGGDAAQTLVNAADYGEWRAANHVFEEMGLVRNAVQNYNLAGDGGEPERLQAARVSASLFRVLGTRAQYGRTFTDAEEKEAVVVLSYGLWKRRFGGDPSIVGRSIPLSGLRFTVVGIMPPSFSYPTPAYQVWVPLPINPAELSRAVGGFGYMSVARLRRGVSIDQAQREMTALARRVAASHVGKDSAGDAIVDSLLDDVIQPVRATLLLLLGAVGGFLLIACLNVATLFGARAARRSTEFAVRLTLGASRGRITAQAFAEVLPIVLVGGVIGVSSAAWAIRLFAAKAPPGLPRIENIALNGPVLTIALGAMILSALVATLLPAAEAWRSDLRGTINDRTRSTTEGARSRRVRSVMVVTQIAVALPLLVASGLLIRSFAKLSRIDPGFKAEGVLSLLVAIPRSKYPGDQPVAAFETRLLDAVRNVPGVDAAGGVNRLPLSGYGSTSTIEVDDRGARPRTVDVDSRPATPRYFETMGIRLVRGRDFTMHDDSLARPVVIVDEQLARSAWPGEDPIGKRLQMPGVGEGEAWFDIVGVVGHVRHEGLDVDRRPQVYWSYLQRPQDRMALVVRSRAELSALYPAVVHAIRSVDPDQPVYDVHPMEDLLRRSTAPRRTTMVLLVAFALAALLLATAGLYGVMSFTVSQRLREFGIRMALGAEHGSVVRLIVRQGVVLGLLGVLPGAIGALAVTGAMSTVVFETSPRDFVTFAGASVVVLAVVMVASYVPARRVASVDPAVTLRAE